MGYRAGLAGFLAQSAIYVPVDAMLRPLTQILGLALALVVTGCGEKGSGVKKTEVRTPGSFSKIQLRSSADVTVKIGYPQSVEVVTDDNLLSLITTDVSGDKLSIGSKGSYNTRLGVKIQIQVPNLNEVAISGSGDMEITGLKEKSFVAKISGSGEIVVEGVATEVEAAVSGSGDIDLGKLTSDKARASVSGSGDIEVNASKTLTASISGSGDIKYHGSPTVVKKVSGSGSVEKK